MIEDKFVFPVVIGVFDVLVEINFVPFDFVEVDVLEELDSLFVFEDLDGGDEDVGGDLPFEGRPDSDHHLDVVAVVVLTLFHYLNIINFNRHPYY